MKIYFLAHGSGPASDCFNFEKFKLGRKFSQMLGRETKAITMILGKREDITFISGYFVGDLQKENENLEISVIEDERLDAKNKGLLGIVGGNYERLFGLVCNIIDLNKEMDAQSNAIILSASKDVFDIMRKDAKIRKLCYFGDEEIKNGKVTRSSQKISEGDIKEIEISRPFQIGYEGKVETIAERRIKERSQREKI